MITKYKEFIKCNESNVDNYNLSSESEDGYKYYFTSSGIKGDIEKVIFFQHDFDDVYNLAYGDVEYDNGEEVINVDNVSNNGDMKEIISTIYTTMCDFSDKHNNLFILIHGSDDKRKSVYDNLISRYYSKINKSYFIYGCNVGGVEIFKVGTKYESILLKPKNKLKTK